MACIALISTFASSLQIHVTTSTPVSRLQKAFRALRRSSEVSARLTCAHIASIARSCAGLALCLALPESSLNFWTFPWTCSRRLLMSELRCCVESCLELSTW